jgi:hypothetical protein
MLLHFSDQYVLSFTTTCWRNNSNVVPFLPDSLYNTLYAHSLRRISGHQGIYQSNVCTLEWQIQNKIDWIFFFITDITLHLSILDSSISSKLFFLEVPLCDTHTWLNGFVCSSEASVTAISVLSTTYTPFRDSVCMTDQWPARGTFPGYILVHTVQ